MFRFIVLLTILAVAIAQPLIISPVLPIVSYPAVHEVELKSVVHEVPLIAPLTPAALFGRAYGYGLYPRGLPAAHLKVDRTPLGHSYEFASHGW